MTQLDRLRALADGPALDLPEPVWQAPWDLSHISERVFADWGDIEEDVNPVVTAEPDRNQVWVWGFALNADRAEELARRLYCAAATIRALRENS